MARPKSNKNAHVNRRGFLKSLLGLSGANDVSGGLKADAAETAGASAAKPDGKFFWTDLRTGNIGFPSGLSVPCSMPGSVMKLVTTAALLNEGMFNPNETIECTGFFQGERDSYRCPRGHGNLSIEQAIAVSCNVFFCKATVNKLGVDTLLEYARQFGLDKTIAGHCPATFPASSHSNVLPLALGLSESLKPNALQLMRVAALIAKRGDIPVLKSAEMDADLLESSEAIKLELSNLTFERLQGGMRMATRIGGTAEALDEKDKLRLAAKTGTVPHGKKFESWVVGYFPFDDPAHAFCLYAPSGTSHDTAVPLASKQLLSVDWP